METQDNRLTIFVNLIHDSMTRGVFGFNDIALISEANNALNSIAYDISIRIPELEAERDRILAEKNALASQVNTSVIIDGVTCKGEEESIVVGNEGEELFNAEATKKRRTKA